ncbi:MAG: hypothetical protein K2O14_11185, partial [Oscillospiraceae bacterium]|nr:hypothetical protein [Oscillospiraceae bacterium]
KSRLAHRTTPPTTAVFPTAAEYIHAATEAKEALCSPRLIFINKRANCLNMKVRKSDAEL